VVGAAVLARVRFFAPFDWNRRMAGGRVSEVALWRVNLYGGQVIRLLFGGD
jgi:hypothetical protein